MIVRIALLSVVLAGCASGPKREVQSVPSYREKVRTSALIDVRGACAEVPPNVTDHHRLVPLANACVKAKQWPRVETFGQRLATGDDQTPWGPYYLSLAASARADYARAKFMIELSLRKAPDQALFHFERARVLGAMKDNAGVIAEMKRAAELDPNLTEAHLFNGQLAFRQNDLPRARAALTRALKSAPEHPTALLTLADVLMRSNDFNGAEDTLRRAIRANPRHLAARLALAQVQENQLKKYDEALGTLRELTGARDLDGPKPAGLDDRIQRLEKTIARAKPGEDASTRMPSAERK